MCRYVCTVRWELCKYMQVCVHTCGAVCAVQYCVLNTRSRPNHCLPREPQHLEPASKCKCTETCGLGGQEPGQGGSSRRAEFHPRPLKELDSGHRDPWPQQDAGPGLRKRRRVPKWVLEPPTVPRSAQQCSLCLFNPPLLFSPPLPTAPGPTGHHPSEVLPQRGAALTRGL